MAAILETEAVFHFMGSVTLLQNIIQHSIPNHWVDTWWANGDVSPSQMADVNRLDLKISDYIQSKAI